MDQSEVAGLEKAKERDIIFGKSFYLVGFDDGVEWTIDNIFGWLAENDLLSDDRSVIQKEWEEEHK